MRHIQMCLIAVAALFMLGHRVATSQDRLPTIPTKQTPSASVSLDGNPKGVPPVDSSIERASQDSAGDVASSDSPLHELAWMVGDWVDQDQEATNETSVKWTKNGAFLIRSFRLSIGRGGSPHRDASHRLGPRRETDSLVDLRLARGVRRRIVVSRGRPVVNANQVHPAGRGTSLGGPCHDSCKRRRFPLEVGEPGD